jgi:hypothetical protein
MLQPLRNATELSAPQSRAGSSCWRIPRVSHAARALATSITMGVFFLLHQLRVMYNSQYYSTTDHVCFDFLIFFKILC